MYQKVIGGGASAASWYTVHESADAVVPQQDLVE